MEQKTMNIYFYSRAELYDILSFTAVFKAMKRVDPHNKIILNTSCEAVFYNNKNVTFQSIENKRPQRKNKDDEHGRRITDDEPRVTKMHGLNNKLHYVHALCEKYNVPYNGELPELFMIGQEADYWCEGFGFSKPIMLIQTHCNNHYDLTELTLKQDLSVHTARKVADVFEQDYEIIHLRRYSQPEIPGIQSFFLESEEDMRTVIGLMKLSKKRLFVDEYAQVMAAALKKPSVVCMYDEAAAAQYSYAIHSHVFANAKTDSYYSPGPYLHRPAPPYTGIPALYDADKIIEALRKQGN